MREKRYMDQPPGTISERPTQTQWQPGLVPGKGLPRVSQEQQLALAQKTEHKARTIFGFSISRHFDVFKGTHPEPASGSTGLKSASISQMIQRVVSRIFHHRTSSEDIRMGSHKEHQFLLPSAYQSPLIRHFAERWQINDPPSAILQEMDAFQANHPEEFAASPQDAAHFQQLYATVREWCGRHETAFANFTNYSLNARKGGVGRFAQMWQQNVSPALILKQMNAYRSQLQSQQLTQTPQGCFVDPQGRPIGTEADMRKFDQLYEHVSEWCTQHPKESPQKPPVREQEMASLRESLTTFVQLKNREDASDLVHQLMEFAQTANETERQELKQWLLGSVPGMSEEGGEVVRTQAQTIFAVLLDIDVETRTQLTAVLNLVDDDSLKGKTAQQAFEETVDDLQQRLKSPDADTREEAKAQLTEFAGKAWVKSMMETPSPQASTLRALLSPVPTQSVAASPKLPVRRQELSELRGSVTTFVQERNGEKGCASVQQLMEFAQTANETERQELKQWLLGSVGTKFKQSEEGEEVILTQAQTMFSVLGKENIQARTQLTAVLNLVDDDSLKGKTAQQAFEDTVDDLQQRLKSPDADTREEAKAQLTEFTGKAWVKSMMETPSPHSVILRSLVSLVSEPSAKRSSDPTKAIRSLADPSNKLIFRKGTLVVAPRDTSPAGIEARTGASAEAAKAAVHALQELTTQYLIAEQQGDQQQQAAAQEALVILGNSEWFKGVIGHHATVEKTFSTVACMLLPPTPQNLELLRSIPTRSEHVLMIEKSFISQMLQNVFAEKDEKTRRKLLNELTETLATIPKENRVKIYSKLQEMVVTELKKGPPSGQKELTTLLRLLPLEQTRELQKTIESIENPEITTQALAIVKHERVRTLIAMNADSARRDQAAHDASSAEAGAEIREEGRVSIYSLSKYAGGRKEVITILEEMLNETPPEISRESLENFALRWTEIHQFLPLPEDPVKRQAFEEETQQTKECLLRIATAMEKTNPSGAEKLRASIKTFGSPPKLVTLVPGIPSAATLLATAIAKGSSSLEYSNAVHAFADDLFEISAAEFQTTSAVALITTKQSVKAFPSIFVNQLTTLTRSTILNCSTLQAAHATIHFWLDVAEEALQRGDFATASAIQATLESDAAVNRLVFDQNTNTPLINSSDFKRLQELKYLTNPLGSYKAVRPKLSARINEGRPTIPFINLATNDIDKAIEGADTLTGTVPEQALASLGKCIGWVDQCQSSLKSLTPKRQQTTLQIQLASTPRLSDDEAYKLSLTLRPRPPKPAAS
jgi:hypothetical protein